MKRTIPAVFVAATLLFVSVACTQRDATALGCLGSGRPVHPVTPLARLAYAPSGATVIPDHAVIDARGATFDDTTLDSSGYAKGVKLYFESGSRADMCFVGGSVFSVMDPVTTPWDTWHKVTGFTVLTPNMQIVGTHFFNQGDAISIASTAATNFKIIGVAVDGGGNFPGGYIHDDCVENDAMNSGLISDSKFDGCQDFLSSIGNLIDGGANHVEVTNTLVRLQSMHNSYNPAKYGFDQHGGFFKWASVASRDGVAPQLYVHDSTFRADSPAPYAGNANGMLGLPPNTRCDHVTLINTATWPAKDLASWTSQCTHITFGTTADWNAKVAMWNSLHPAIT